MGFSYISSGYPDTDLPLFEVGAAEIRPYYVV